MARPVTLTGEQADVLIAFHDAFDLHVTGAWLRISDAMAEAGIEDPEDAVETALAALRGERS